MSIYGLSCPVGGRQPDTVRLPRPSISGERSSCDPPRSTFTSMLGPFLLELPSLPSPVAGNPSSGAVAPSLLCPSAVWSPMSSPRPVVHRAVDVTGSSLNPRVGGPPSLSSSRVLVEPESGFSAVVPEHKWYWPPGEDGPSTAGSAPTPRPLVSSKSALLRLSPGPSSDIASLAFPLKRLTPSCRRRDAPISGVRSSLG